MQIYEDEWMTMSISILRSLYRMHGLVLPVKVATIREDVFDRFKQPVMPTCKLESPSYGSPHKE